VRETFQELAKFTLKEFASINELFVQLPLKTVDGNPVPTETLFEFHHRVIAVGIAGTGKTTFLRFFSSLEARKYILAPEDNPCPIFISGRDLSGTDTVKKFLVRVSDLISKRTSTEIGTDELERLFSLGRVSLILDGLDEIPQTVNTANVIYTLSDFARYFPNSQILLSSRPSDLGISFPGFSYLYLSDFDSDKVRQLIFALAEGDRETAERFLTALSEQRSLRALSTTPLLLSLLWNVFRVRGSVPQTSALLYSDFTDFLLTARDARTTGGNKTSLTLDGKHRLLERIAVHQFEYNLTAGLEEISELISRSAQEFHIEKREEPYVLEELLSSGLLVEVSRSAVQFVHLSFLEYYVAKALVRTPQNLINLVSRPNAHQILVFACAMVSDVAPIIQAAIETRQLALAAKCISHGRTDNQQLAEYVVHEFIEEFGEPFAKLLLKVLDNRKEEKPEADPYVSLLRKWDGYSQDNLAAHIKGSRFEEFAIEFFSQSFAVVSHDLNTENGELDLILEIIKKDSFWIEFGGDVFVECKNWASNIPLKDVGAFVAKVTQGRVKLAFFISASGFTGDAEERLRIQASNVAAPLIVPINGIDIKEMLQKREYFEEFFKRKIRDIKYLRKW
jgi:hypothetical protein